MSEKDELLILVDSLRSKIFIKRIQLPFIIFTIIVILILILNRSQKCTASDFAPDSPVEKTFSAFTTEAACKKAYAICTYYSSNPKDCRIKQSDD